MPLTTDKTEKETYQPLPKDVYNSALRDITEGSGERGTWWRWDFEVDSAETPPTGLWKTKASLFTSNNVHPDNKSKNSPRLVVAALLGRAIEDGEFCEPEEYEDLLGTPCRLAVAPIVSKKDGKLYNDIETVLSVRKQTITGTTRQPNPERPMINFEAVQQRQQEEQGYIRRYELAKNALGWDNDKVRDAVEWNTQAPEAKPFHKLATEHQAELLTYMEAEAAKTDVPFESGEEEDELTAAGLVSASPTVGTKLVPSARGRK